MQEYPSLTVLINTFRRDKELSRTIEGLWRYLNYPQNSQKWVIADDCSGDEYNASYRIFMQDFNDLFFDARFTSTPVNSGWGASANNAIQQITTPYIFHLDDDFMLTRALNLVQGVALMEAVPTIGMIRYSALDCGERYTYQQHVIELDGVKVPYLILDKDSPSLYLYSQTPRLYGHRWFTRYGLFPETGLTLGEAEEYYCHHVKDILQADDSAPQIAVFPEWIRDGFTIEREHSWQFTEFDKRHEVKA